MTLAATLEGLDASLAAVCAGAEALRLTVDEDAPRRRATLLVEESGERAGELAALAAAAAAPVRELLEDPEPPEREAIRRALGFAHERRIELERTLERLAEPRRLFELADLAGRHGADWTGWLASVLAGLDELRPQLTALDEALLACWGELAETPHLRIDSAQVGRLRVARHGAVADLAIDPQPGGV
jgi:hypothetical protein